MQRFVYKVGPISSALAVISALFFISSPVGASAAGEVMQQSFTSTYYGLFALAIFLIAYAAVIGEEFLHMRKSKPVVLATGFIWFLVALAYATVGDQQTPASILRHNILEYAELFLFLLAAMTYINTLDERNMFQALRAWLVSKGFTLRTIFWLTGLLAFCLSPIADNLTTALLMGAVVTAVGAGNNKFVVPALINVVVAANAGGAFSPFGDITTLMVWQKGLVEFSQFFALFLPSLVNWLIPASIMSMTIPKTRSASSDETVFVKKGGFVVVGLFLITIFMAVSSFTFLHLPPVLGMMTGLGMLKIYGYRLRRFEIDIDPGFVLPEGLTDIDHALLGEHFKPKKKPFDIFISMKRSEWDTLMFFYGVILCIGGLGALGYLAMISEFFYMDLGPTTANILVGILSALVDNIPVMFAVLTMNPEMDLSQWLLVTLTAGVGGSLLSIGSAAGVAVMGQARGVYTFFAHLKWSWAIALGYAGSIAVHLWIN